MPKIQTEWIIDLDPPADPEFIYEKRKAQEAPPAELEFIYEKRELQEAPPAEQENPDETFELSAEFAVKTETPAGSEIIVEARQQEEAPAEFEVIIDALETERTVPEPEAEPLRPFVAAAPPTSLRMADPDHEMAWELLRQGRELYEKHDYMSAVSLLKKAARLHPGQGDFHYLLGLCQSKVELFENEAEINLKKAIELKSWSADPVYALGALYRGHGKMKLAERCFQRVKEISYEHTGASRALVDLRRLRAPKKKR